MVVVNPATLSMATKAIGLGFSLFGKKGNKQKKATPIERAAANLATSGYQTSSIATPGRPDSGGNVAKAAKSAELYDYYRMVAATPGRPSTGDTAKKASSAELYDYYRMVAAAKLVAERLDPTSGTKLGKFGAIKDSSIG